MYWLKNIMTKIRHLISYVYSYTLVYTYRRVRTQRCVFILLYNDSLISCLETIDKERVVTAQ